MLRYGDEVVISVLFRFCHRPVEADAGGGINKRLSSASTRRHRVGAQHVRSCMVRTGSGTEFAVFVAVTLEPRCRVWGWTPKGPNGEDEQL